MALVYTVAIAALLVMVGALLLRGQRRRRREMQALRTVMRQVLDEGPEQEKPQGEDS